ncbi:MAG: crotonase/enoyl-CoA hydratase family protein [Proteobacteria bacterium]|nr:crotonase/enoyl-CoA hydratase family protein [Pseudomonadota bacterium]
MNLTELEGLETLNVSIEDKIAHIQLCRPKQFNTMNAAFWRELPRVIKAIDREAAARVIVISSTGKHFTAGMDLQVFAKMGESAGGEPARYGESFRRLVLELQAAFNALENARMPVLVAIQGGCIGGGVDMVCAADSRYCTADAFFTIKETALAMTADLGTLQRLPHLMPQGLVRELAYTSRKFTATEALNTGFVNRVFDTQQEMLIEVMAIAQQIARQSPMAVAGSKEMFNYSRDHGVVESLRYMATWQAGMFSLSDVQQAMKAQMESRDATFEELRPGT